MILLLGILLGGIALDQFTKWLALAFLRPVGQISLIPRVLEFTFLTNEGIAGGMLSGNKIATLVLPTLGILVLIYYLFCKCPKNKWIQIPLALIVSGGVGNLIDRFFRVGVVDFISMPWLPWVSTNPLRLVDFPVFNLADILVTVGGGILIVYLLLEAIKEEKTKKREKKDEKQS